MDAQQRDEIVARARRDGEARNALSRWLCSNCGSLMKPRKVAQGSGAIETALWIAGIILVLSIALSGIGVAVLAVAVVYSIWRFASPRRRECSACKSPQIFPADTPRGRDELVRRGLLESPEGPK